MTQPALGRKEILDMAAGFSSACVLGAAAELEVFNLLGDRAMTAEEVAAALPGDLRATQIVLDATAALGLLDKQEMRYSVPAGIRPYLNDNSPRSVLPMILHRMNILRAWAQLASVVKVGAPPPRVASIRGPEADRAAFVAAMHTVSGPIAEDLVARLGPIPFRHFLDVGGASGTWTLAFLRAAPRATATLFDLPDAVEQARARIAQCGMADRIRLVAGDFYTDDLPAGADFAWVSAIAHQHSREHNRRLFAKVHEALVPGGRIGIRDVVMEPCRTQPVEGAMFAVNMLVNTETGGTFTFDEYAEDLQAAGFAEPELRVKSQWMDSVILARRRS